MPAPAESSAPEDPAQRGREASARHSVHVSELLDRRADLQGVSRLADLIRDAARWTA